MSHPHRSSFLLSAALLGILLAGRAAPAQEPPLPAAADREVDFERDVRPLFAGRCVRCHGPARSEGGLRLDRRGPAREGGNRGPAWEAGKSAASRLIQYVAGLDKDLVMPPS